MRRCRFPVDGSSTGFPRDCSTPACLILWSVATAFMGVIGGFVALIALRLLVGVFEAPAYPINNRVATAWYPERERATVIGFYTSGQFIGLALLTPFLSWLQSVLSWHWVFIVTGTIGAVWGAVWYAFYREPRDSRANDAEIDLIRDGGGLVDLLDEQQPERPAVTRNDVATVLGRRKLWGIYLGQFCLTSTLWFFLTWFPTYLVEYRDMDYIKSGFLASLPFVAALVGVLFSGVFSDFLLRKGRVSRSRPQGADHRGTVADRRDDRRQLHRLDGDGDRVPVHRRSSATGSRRSRGRWCRRSRRNACSGSPVECSTSSATCRRSRHPS